ncbi:2-dehydro-3-deoxygalactonokinase [Rhodobacteraceae bacterium 2376]|uniref:2-dehydro-3-deoxygalactonokinase n=1 Tax=Rhabdonatronobacter sediminivivens TaxID=2743469 RepID=A0A7Z0KX60_9RHOB|nr:2-dehydro-3-deoxygalactonokinase [Rhabdonatronobacter sediminivivens]NYS24125.1 2-dehydro-3-deoxygalactonokinase [Rhabdonatronobacter sediminivivens]
MNKPDWIGAEIDEARLRIWAMAGPTPVHAAETTLGGATPAATASTLGQAVIEALGTRLPGDRTLPVVACGLAPARGAAGFRPVPCTPLGDTLRPAPLRDLRLSLHLVPGLSQAQPTDAMLGAETRIAGFLARNPGWDGVLCLPGAQSRWVHLSAGEVVSFQTFLTGALTALLEGHSILRDSVSGWEDAAFVDGVRAGMERPERLAARLFTLHAEALIQGQPPAGGRARLSGLLIGAELAAAKPYWLGQRVAVLGAPSLAEQYARALADLAVPTSTCDDTEMTLAGLARARALIAPGPAPGTAH